MAPDINSLPPSRSTSASPLNTRSTNTNMPSGDSLLRRTPSPSPRSSPVTLAAAATINAADLSRRNSASRGGNRGSPRPSRASERRRSAIAMNLNLNDPGVPGPGELQASGAAGDHHHRGSISHRGLRASSPTSLTMGDLHRQRSPSLGMLHQELEQEQEAQVNRLLQMIRSQQTQLQQLQAQQQSHHHSSLAVDDSTPNSELSFSLPTTTPLPIPHQRPISHSRSISRPSRPPSQAVSPALHPRRQNSYDGREEFPSLVSVSTSPHDSHHLRRGSREESAFYQAETSNLTRENQMLRQRIRELERQVAEMKERSDTSGSRSSSTAPHRGSLSGLVRESIPVQSSNLATSVEQSQGGTGETN